MQSHGTKNVWSRRAHLIVQLMPAHISNMSGKRPTTSPKDEETLSLPSNTTETATVSPKNTPKIKETPMPWMWMQFALKNLPQRNNKDALTTTFASSVENQDMSLQNVETPLLINRNKPPPPLPRSKKYPTTMTLQLLEKFPPWIFRKGNLPDARDP